MLTKSLKNKYSSLTLVEKFFSISVVTYLSWNLFYNFILLDSVFDLLLIKYAVKYASTVLNIFNFETESEVKNIKGASSCYNPSNPYEIQYVMKGGSFLCHDSYCASYRISARMGVSVGSGSDHTGFRTVATPEMLLNK
mgnify:CR=1 FL=1